MIKLAQWKGVFFREYGGTADATIKSVWTCHSLIDDENN